MSTHSSLPKWLMHDHRLLQDLDLAENDGPGAIVKEGGWFSTLMDITLCRSSLRSI
jgi:hypothetical protein